MKSTALEFTRKMFSHLSPLHKAVINKNIQLIHDLLDKGADVNAKDSREYNTPLHLVARRKRLCEIAKILTDAGADLEIVNHLGLTPLHMAVMLYNIPVIEHLLACGANVNARDIANNTPLKHFVRQFPERIGEGLQARYLELAEKLLKNKADVNAVDELGYTPMHFAVIRSNNKLVELFLNFNPNLNIQSNNGETVLNIAALHSSLKITRLLVDHGADVNNASVLDGSTAFHWACWCFDKKIVKFLLKRGADINALDFEKRTPLMFMLANDDYQKIGIQALKYLLGKWPAVNTIDSGGKNVLTIRPDQDYQKIVVEHLAKMEMLNHTVHPSLINTISDDSNLNNYFTKCKEELLLARDSRIHNDSTVTFFHLLGGNKTELANYAGNEGLVKSFKNCDIVEKFPIYSCSMKRNMDKAIKRRQLCDDAEESLENIFPVNSHPSHLILRKIVNYLEKKDLQSLSELNSNFSAK